MISLFYRWHRRIAWIVLIPLLAFGISGLLHPLMRLSAPEIAQHSYSQPQWPANLPSISQLQDLPLKHSTGLRPVKVAKTWYLSHWQERTTPSQFYTLTGDTAIGIEQRYAIQLARHFSGDQNSPVRDVVFISEFSRDYPAINRLLPVWKVSFDRDDQLSTFVDIRLDRLATQTNSTRSNLMFWFRLLHTWMFIDVEHPLRTTLFIGLMLLSALIACSGLYLFCKLPSRSSSRRSSRSGSQSSAQNATSQRISRYHRFTGISISLALLMFVFSGLVRTIEKQTPEIRSVFYDQQIDLSSAKLGPAELHQRYKGLTQLSLHQLAKKPVWQLTRPQQPDLWVNAITGQPIADAAEKYALQLLQDNNMATSAGPITSLVQVNSFRQDPSYGFIDKRLPVTAVEFAKQRFYIDSRDSVLSVAVSESDHIYSWIFRFLHKWRFADGIGKTGRDGLIAVAILLICASSLLGVYSWYRKYSYRLTILKAQRLKNKNSGNT